MNDYVSALLPRNDGSLLLGHYGGGLTTIVRIGASLPLQPQKPQSSALTLNQTVPFPAPAEPPDAAALQDMARQVKASASPLPPSSAYYLGEDWVTLGDWVARYGRQYARLCGIDSILTRSPDYSVEGRMGPHHAPGDGMRRWVQWMQTDNPKTLYAPSLGVRRQAEWDDHGEGDAYLSAGNVMAYQGPDLWIKVTLKEGDLHRISLYFFNKDAHYQNANDGDYWYNRCRDFVVELKPYKDTLEQAEAAPTLARARVVNFWGGVYQQFVVRSPGSYYIKIAKNYSIDTIVSAVLIDKLEGKTKVTDTEPIVFLGNIPYAPPPSPAPAPGNGQAAAAQTLWAALDSAQDRPDALDRQRAYRLLAYRALLHAGGSETRLADWRWCLRLWTPPDREQFALTMARAWKIESARQAEAARDMARPEIQAIIAQFRKKTQEK